MNTLTKAADDETLEGVPADQIPEEERGRADIYRLLAILLARAPDAATHRLIGALEPDESALGNALRALSAVARARSVESISEEFDALFLGVPNPRIMPYASYYLNGQLFGRPLAELRMQLAKLGVARKADATEPEDHLATLCEIMSGLIMGAFSTGPLPLEEQRAFFRAHIAPWASMCFDDLAAAEPSAFYMAVGQLGQAFLQTESEAFIMVSERG